MSQICLYGCGGLRFRGPAKHMAYLLCSVLLTTRSSLHYPTEEDWAQTGLVTMVDCRQMPCGGAWNGGKREGGLGVPGADV